MTDSEDAFSVQPDIRGPWRSYLDRLTPLRPDLHRYCVRLTGNVWDGEDLVQDALMRVFSQMGRLDADLENPRAYLIRTATHLFIDRVRRLEVERSGLATIGRDPTSDAASGQDPQQGARVREAAGLLISQLPPRERAALLMKDIFDLSITETSSVLKTTEGAVKAALHRGRSRLASEPATGLAPAPPPPAELVEAFMQALTDKDLAKLESICSADLSVELVGGAEMEGFEKCRPFFEHAHFVMPEMGFGEDPNWKTAVYCGEPVVLGFRTLDGIEALNEVHRLVEQDGRITTVRCYCFSPDVLATVGEDLGIPALRRPYRSPG